MGIYPYSPLFGARCNWFRNGESVGCSVLPHMVGAVAHKPTILHPAGQSEVQVHPDVVFKSLVVGQRVGTERAVPVRYLTLNHLAPVDQTAAPFHFPCGGWADYVIQPDVPVPSVVRVAGINNKALDTTEDVDNIATFDRSDLGTFLRDSHHPFFLQDILPHLNGLSVLAGF